MTDKGRARAPEEIARTRIEALLKEGKLPTLETLLKREVLDLNELSLDLLTHQVEIEVQAEQLREANAALEAERRKFEQIFFYMPVAAGLIDLGSGVLTAENPINTSTTSAAGGPPSVAMLTLKSSALSRKPSRKAPALVHLAPWKTPWRKW